LVHKLDAIANATEQRIVCAQYAERAVIANDLCSLSDQCPYNDWIFNAQFVRGCGSGQSERENQRGDITMN
jgi:hypothetical protein